MSEEEVRAPFRLAFRKEGEFVNAYLADTNTMEGAKLIGSIRVTLIEGRVDFWDRYKALMREMFSVMIENTLGFAPSRMDEERAPEHERSGHG